MKLRPALTAAVFLLLSVLWTWPAIQAPGLVGRMPDAAGTAWFIWASPRLLLDLHDGLSGWPAGVTYARPDSYLLLLFGPLLNPLGPARAHAWLAVFGLAASAWAAEAFSRELGARAPWSWLAGSAFAFSGLASSALLEGYVYHLVNPWLPLLALYWFRATRPGGSMRQGLAAAAFFLLCLLTSAWMALAALPLVLGFLAGALLRQRRAFGWWPVAAAGLAVAAPASVYLARFLASGGSGQEQLELVGNPARPLAWALVHLAAPLTTVDLDGHSQSNTLPAVALVLTMVAPVVLRDSLAWRRVAWTGLLALVLCLAPSLFAGAPLDGASGQGAKALSILGAALLRFPDRLEWTTLLCLGAVGALVATRLADRLDRRPWPLFVLALADAFLVLRMPWRQQVAPAGAPSAYAADVGPVLDLWPEEVSPAPAWTLRTTNLGCYYQSGHGRPIADLCITSPGTLNPRLRLGQWVSGRLLAGESAEVAERLASFGFRTVALHPDFFSRPNRLALEAALGAIDPSPVDSTDGGGHVRAYAVPVDPGATPAASWAAWPGRLAGGPSTVR